MGFLGDILSEEREKALAHAYDDFASYELALSIVKHFRINNIWADLLAINPNSEYWKLYVSYATRKNVPVWNFFPSQRSALKNGILSNKTTTLQMPTSSGKTALSELAIYNEVSAKPKQKILYLAPFRSLAAELKLIMGKDLGKMGIRTKSIYGGHIPSREEQEAIDNVQLLIATPEKMMAVEDVMPTIFENFSTIICDEGHLLDDFERGLNYELLLSRLKSDEEIERRFIFISAIIPNVGAINDWLGGSEETLVQSEYRPTNLEFAYLRKVNNENYDLNVNPYKEQPEKYQLYWYLTENELVNEDDSTITTKRELGNFQ